MGSICDQFGGSSTRNQLSWLGLLKSSKALSPVRQWHLGTVTWGRFTAFACGPNVDLCQLAMFHNIHTSQYDIRARILAVIPTNDSKAFATAPVFCDAGHTRVTIGQNGMYLADHLQPQVSLWNYDQMNVLQ